MAASTESRPRDRDGGDIAVRGIVWAALGLATTAVLMALATFALFRSFTMRDRPASPPPAIESLLPAEPRIQSAPGDDMRAMRQEEDRLVNSYQWVDQRTGIARIPVSRAMRLLVERGMPVRGATPPAVAVPSAPAQSPSSDGR